MKLEAPTKNERPTARLVALVEPSLAKRLIAQAQANDRTASGEVRHLLRSALDARKANA